MSIKRESIATCCRCGKKSTLEDARGWRFETQPTVATCPECLARGEQYDADYFLCGIQTGKSLYENYHWMPDLTIPMVCAIVSHLGIAPSDTILDFGCARGYVVKAFRHLGYSARGIDVSEWAIQNADEETKPFLQCCVDAPPLLAKEFDWIIAKDVLEHILNVGTTIDLLMDSARKGVLAIVPLSAHNGSPYVIGDYERDQTHCKRMNLSTWARIFARPEWSVTMQYRMLGIKDVWYRPGYERGNGFITARRIK